MPLTDRDLTDIAAVASALVRADTPGSFATLMLFPSHGNGECPEGCEIVVNPGRAAVRGELLRIDDHLFHNEAQRKHFINALALLLKPLLVGVGHRVISDELAHGVIIFPSEPR